MQFWAASTGGNCNGCSWIAAEGTIVDDTPKAFSDFLKAQQYELSKTVVVFNSPGGNLGAGVRLGALIRQRGLDTGIGITAKDRYVSSLWSRSPENGDGVCASACAYAFLGGVTRWTEGKYGVHQFYAPLLLEKELKEQNLEKGSSDQQIVGLLTVFAKSMGIDTDLIFIASSTPPSEVYWLSKSELLRLKIDNSGDSQDPWRIEPYRDGAIATTTIRSGGTDARNYTLFCRDDGGRRPYLLVSQRFSPPVKPEEVRRTLNFGWGIGFDAETVGMPGPRKFGPEVNVTASSDGTIYLTLPLSNADLDRLSKARSMSVTVNSAKYMSYPFDGNLSLTGAWASIALAMRNCIR